MTNIWEQAILEHEIRVRDERLRDWAPPKPKITDKEKQYIIEQYFPSSQSIAWTDKRWKASKAIWDKLKCMYLRCNTTHGFDSDYIYDYHVDETKMYKYFEDIINYRKGQR